MLHQAWHEAGTGVACLPLKYYVEEETKTLLRHEK